MAYIIDTGVLVVAPISIGELFDKISILSIKIERINDEAKVAHAQTELTQLEALRSQVVPDSGLIDVRYRELLEVNGRLWDIEDAIRLKENAQIFDEEFVELARSVYKQNDIRAEIKRTINNAFGSAIVEVKSYSSILSVTRVK